MKFSVKIIVVFVLILSSHFLNAQVVKFRKVIGASGYDYGMSAKQTMDKGYIIGGSTSSFGNGNSDVYVVKTDSMGIVKRDKTFGGINVDRGNCIRQTSDKGYIIVGYTNSFGAGGYDVYLIKTDSSLNTLWTKTYGGTDWDFGSCVEPTTDGGYIICGSTYSYGKGNEDYYLIKTTSNGDTVWTKTFGGTKEDEAKSVIQTSDGGYLLTGYTKSKGDTLGDFYTVKTNSLGDTLWTNKFGGPLADYGNDVLESVSGGYIVGGETKNFGAGDSDGIIIKISTAGITGMNFTIGNTRFDNIESITQAADGKIAMTGKTVSYGDGDGNGDVYFFIVDNNWNFYSATTFGTNALDIGFSVEPTADNAFIICGYTEGFNNKLDDIYLIKTDALGLSNVAETTFITGINENSTSENKLTIYPNPAKNLAILNLCNFKNKTTIEFFDILGKQISTQVVDADLTPLLSVNTGNLMDGIYMIKIQSEGFSSTQKLIIQH
jgi:hypothetical protein